MRYLRLLNRKPCQAISEFPDRESQIFAGMNNETPGLMQYTFTSEIDISATELSGKL